MKHKLGYIYSSILDKIIENKKQTGYSFCYSEFVEKDVAEQLNTSEIEVRACIMILTAQGLINNRLHIYDDGIRFYTLHLPHKYYGGIK